MLHQTAAEKLLSYRRKKQFYSTNTLADVSERDSIGRRA
jgi:hypothetical protein